MTKNYGNFKVKNEDLIKEINVKVIELCHEPSGAEIIHIESDDDENLFNICFRTFPESSNGCAHVLEHIVLCGSEKFPVKDPFFAMGRRSMNTFMNALTGTDFTCYPAASQIESDFYNLLDVYLDAVFHPRLTQESFWQEGIHLEFSEKANPRSPLILKGIVYNEMKGAMANPDSRLHEAVYESLFPDLPYHFNSGGNPEAIRTLTVEDVKNFHKKYYHPSRALFYFYGNLPLKKHLDFLEEHTLRHVEKLPPLPLLPKQKRFTKPKESKAFYPVTLEDDKKDKSLIAASYLTSSILAQEELLALHVIDLALMGTDAAPLKQAILASDLCKQVESSLDDEISEVPYTIECKGCLEENFPLLIKLIHDTCEKIAKSGIAKHLIEGALHQLEFSRTEIAGHSFPYGLSLFFRSGLLKQHGGNPTDGLKIHTLFKILRENFEDPTYLPTLMRKYILNNPHSVHIVMKPDHKLAMKEMEDEMAFVKRIDDALTEEDRKKILKNEVSLAKYQEEQGDLEKLPRLKLNQVPKINKDFPLNKEQIGGLTLYHHDCFTNDILYSGLYFALPDVDYEDLVFLKLFTLFITELGAGGRNYKDQLDFVFQHTGGLSCDLDLFINSENQNLLNPEISLKGKALHRNADKLFHVFNDILQMVDFTDSGRIEELLVQHLEGLENSVQKSPLHYAVNLATSGFSPASTLHYLWNGLSYVESIKQIVKDFEEDPTPFIKKMESLKEKTLNVNDGTVVLGVQSEMCTYLKDKDFFGLSREKRKRIAPFDTKKIPIEKVISQGRTIAGHVAFNVLAFPTFPYHHPFSPLLSVAGELMESKVLHKRIREQGGAYGGGASNSPSWGYFYFYSYRDPHIKTTLEAFEEAVSELIKLNFDDRELEEAKLGVLQNLDSPTPPESRAFVAYSWLKSGRTVNFRQEFRTKLMNATKADIKKVATEVLLPGLKSGTFVSFGGKELLTKENELLKQKIPIFTV